MVKELTPEQKELMLKVKQEYIDLYKVPFDLDAAQEWYDWLYEFSNFSKVPVYGTSSPDAMQLKAKELAGKKPDDPDYPPSAYGNCNDFGWIGFYDFFSRIGIVQHENFTKYKRLITLGVYDSIQFDEACVVCEMPLYIKRNDEDLIHADMSPAMEWADGCKKYYLNGTPVPEELAMKPATQLSLDFFTQEKNADVRTEFVRKYGVDRMAKMGKVVDHYSNYTAEALGSEQSKYWYEKSKYELIDMSFLFTERQNIPYAPHLKMWHQTMETFVVEPVDPSCTTIVDALNDRTDMDTTQYEIKDIK